MRKKRQSSQQSHLALSGSTSVKAVRRTLMKLTPDVTQNGTSTLIYNNMLLCLTVRTDNHSHLRFTRNLDEGDDACAPAQLLRGQVHRSRKPITFPSVVNFINILGAAFFRNCFFFAAILYTYNFDL